MDSLIHKYFQLKNPNIISWIFITNYKQIIVLYKMKRCSGLKLDELLTQHSEYRALC